MIAGINPAVHAAAHLVTLRLMQSLAGGSLVALLAAVVLARPHHNARTRFAIWFSSLIAIAAVPLITGEWLWNAQTLIGQPVLRVPDSWALYLFGAWAVTAASLLLGVARSLVHLRGIRKSCVEIDTAVLEPSIRETLGRHRLRRNVVLCMSTKVRVPTALGLMNPAIVIPEWLIQELSPEELKQILLHELAHLHRWDDWTNLAQQLIKAIFFFHPAVWWIERKVALEREMACDDAVLSETNSPRMYAECLAKLAEKSFVRRSVVLAQAALGKVRQTTLRVTRILDPDRRSAPSRSFAPAVSLVAVFAIGCGVWSAQASRVIVFDSGTAPKTINAAAYHESPFAVRDFQVSTVPGMATSSQLPKVIPAKLSLRTLASRRSSGVAKAHPRPVHRPASSMQLLHSASAKIADVPVTETIFVVIQNREPDPEGGYAYQIQMWRLTVFRTVVGPTDTQISRKQI